VTSGLDRVDVGLAWKDPRGAGTGDMQHSRLVADREASALTPGGARAKDGP
jgi:hypothetical protein